MEADVEGWLSRGMYAMQLQGDWYSQAGLEHFMGTGWWGSGKACNQEIRHRSLTPTPINAQEVARSAACKFCSTMTAQYFRGPNMQTCVMVTRWSDAAA